MLRWVAGRILTDGLLCLGAVAGAKASGTVQLSTSVQSPLVRFARDKLEQALRMAQNASGNPIEQIQLALQPGKPESYSIRPSGTEITVTGGDARGLMYGTLRLAEGIQLGDLLQSIRSESRSPKIGITAWSSGARSRGRT